MNNSFSDGTQLSNIGQKCEELFIHPQSQLDL